MFNYLTELISKVRQLIKIVQIEIYKKIEIGKNDDDTPHLIPCINLSYFPSHASTAPPKWIWKNKMWTKLLYKMKIHSINYIK